MGGVTTAVDIMMADETGWDRVDMAMIDAMTTMEEIALDKAPRYGNDNGNYVAAGSYDNGGRGGGGRSGNRFDQRSGGYNNNGYYDAEVEPKRNVWKNIVSAFGL